jgi:hypothetical protein
LNDSKGAPNSIVANSTSELEIVDMPSMLKSTILGIALLTGTALATQAQSVSSLPPAGGAPETAAAQPFSSTSRIGPNPGGNSNWKVEHYQPPADYGSNPADHPYSTSIGPKPGSHSSGVDVHYQATAADQAPAEHPYTSSGVGPRAN